MKPELTYELLKELYIDKNMSSGKIAKQLGYGKTWIGKKLKQFGLQDQKSEEDRNKAKYQNMANTNLEKYGSISPFGNKEIQEKIAKTIKSQYGCTHITRSPKIRQKIQQTCLERYGSITPFGNKEVQEKIAEAFASGLPQQKCYDTKSLHSSHNISRDEDIIYELLIEHFSENDVLRQYKSPSYPYPCDFYIKSLDLYIEYQGTWCHGNEPYNPNNRVHQEIVNKWSSKHTEYSDYAVKIWTERDPEKRKIAKENNLNWKEFFSMDELSNWLNSL